MGEQLISMQNLVKDALSRAPDGLDPGSGRAGLKSCRSGARATTPARVSGDAASLCPIAGPEQRMIQHCNLGADRTEWEAALDAGLMAASGLAQGRPQPQKVQESFK